MATLDGDFGGGLTNAYTGDRIGLREGSYTFQPVRLTYFKMRGQDVDCGPLTYRTWIVTDAPDFIGTQYTGSRCGVTPFSNVVIADSWTR